MQNRETQITLFPLHFLFCNEIPKMGHNSSVNLPVHTGKNKSLSADSIGADFSPGTISFFISTIWELNTTSTGTIGAILSNKSGPVQ